MRQCVHLAALDREHGSWACGGAATRRSWRRPSLARRGRAPGPLRGCVPRACRPRCRHVALKQAGRVGGASPVVSPRLRNVGRLRSCASSCGKMTDEHPKRVANTLRFACPHALLCRNRATLGVLLPSSRVGVRPSPRANAPNGARRRAKAVASRSRVGHNAAPRIPRRASPFPSLPGTWNGPAPSRPAGCSSAPRRCGA